MLFRSLCVTVGTGFNTAKKTEDEGGFITSESIQKTVMKSLGLDEIKTVYDTQYQAAANSRINEIKSEKDCSFEKPLFIMNPFGTNVTGVYVYFKTNEAVNVEYTVSVNDKDITDFTRTIAACVNVISLKGNIMSVTHLGAAFVG